MEDPDSLSYYVLSAFEKSTQYFKDSDKEELGISFWNSIRKSNPFVQGPGTVSR